jgi:antirestriction protein ArdC
MTTKTRGLSDEDRRERAAALHASIADQVEQLKDSQRWTAFLDFAASFHQFSFHNVCLLLAQNPHASRVAGFRQWEAKGRLVRKGEKSLKIFGYSTRKTGEQDEKTGEDKRSVYYPVLSVFDISQTELMPGHDDNSTLAHRLTGADDLGIFQAIVEHLQGTGWAVARAPISGGMNGYATADGTRTIVIDDSLEPVMAAKTALHEAAHVTLSHTEQDYREYLAHRGLFEAEAESVAYVLAGLLGLDTSEYSIGYIAGWADADTDLIRSTATQVLAAVHTLADALTGANEAAQSAA